MILLARRKRPRKAQSPAQSTSILGTIVRCPGRQLLCFIVLLCNLGQTEGSVWPCQTTRFPSQATGDDIKEGSNSEPRKHCRCPYPGEEPMELWEEGKQIQFILQSDHPACQSIEIFLCPNEAPPKDHSMTLWPVDKCPEFLQQNKYQSVYTKKTLKQGNQNIRPRFRRNRQRSRLMERQEIVQNILPTENMRPSVPRQQLTTKMQRRRKRVPAALKQRHKQFPAYFVLLPDNHLQCVAGSGKQRMIDQHKKQRYLEESESSVELQDERFDGNEAISMRPSWSPKTKSQSSTQHEIVLVAENRPRSMEVPRPYSWTVEEAENIFGHHNSLKADASDSGKVFPDHTREPTAQLKSHQDVNDRNNTSLNFTSENATSFPSKTTKPISTLLLQPSGSTNPNKSVYPTLSPKILTTPSTGPSQQQPLELPSLDPSSEPTSPPSNSALPTVSPRPFAAPTVSKTPSFIPSLGPTNQPTVSTKPSSKPSTVRDKHPSIANDPSNAPTTTVEPSAPPTASPSKRPTVSLTPSSTPSAGPSDGPSVSVNPSNNPSVSKRPSVSYEPSGSPSSTVLPSTSPSKTPSDTPSSEPSLLPTRTITPSLTPSLSKTPTSSKSPSVGPTLSSAPGSIVIGSLTPSQHIPSSLPSSSTWPSISLRPSISPSSLPTESSIPSGSAAPSSMPSSSVSSVLPSAIPTMSLQPPASERPSHSPTQTPFPSSSPTSSSQPSSLPTITDELSLRPSWSPRTGQPSIATPEPTSTPIARSAFPSKISSNSPSEFSKPSARPSQVVTLEPSGQPSVATSIIPSQISSSISPSESSKPSTWPSEEVSSQPSWSPRTDRPSEPTISTTKVPFLEPTSSRPSSRPSETPTSVLSSKIPSSSPSESSKRSIRPSEEVSSRPSWSPRTDRPSEPTISTTKVPFLEPTSSRPSSRPSETPTSVLSSKIPSSSPSESSKPSIRPLEEVSSQPSWSPRTGRPFDVQIVATKVPFLEPISSGPSSSPVTTSSDNLTPLPPTISSSTLTMKQSNSPSRLPFEVPRNAPTLSPLADIPTVASGHPSADPIATAPTSSLPTKMPSGSLLLDPTWSLNVLPTWSPTGMPTWNPTIAPSWSQAPTKLPLGSLLEDPTWSPTEIPTWSPTEMPTWNPMIAPSWNQPPQSLVFQQLPNRQSNTASPVQNQRASTTKNPSGMPKDPTTTPPYVKPLHMYESIQFPTRRPSKDDSSIFQSIITARPTPIPAIENDEIPRTLQPQSNARGEFLYPYNEAFRANGASSLYTNEAEHVSTATYWKDEITEGFGRIDGNDYDPVERESELANTHSVPEDAESNADVEADEGTAAGKPLSSQAGIDNLLPPKNKLEVREISSSGAVPGRDSIFLHSTFLSVAVAVLIFW